jgi:hypothetical protein
MGDRGSRKRPVLDPGPLEVLNAALPELRGRAGNPGARELARLVTAGGIKTSP